MNRWKLIAPILCLMAVQVAGCRPRRVVYYQAAPARAPAPAIVGEEPVLDEQPVSSEEIEEEVVPTSDVPADQVEHSGPPPSSTHVWIGGRWRWTGHAWVWTRGHWVTRPHHHPQRTWVPGHWERRRHAWVWRAGHWR
jgi:hypothetical protein